MVESAGREICEARKKEKRKHVSQRRDDVMKSEPASVPPKEKPSHI